MWIPGHAGITGNRLGDDAAKYATYASIITNPSISKSDIKRTIRKHIKEQEIEPWTNYHHHYKYFNPDRVAPIHSHLKTKNVH